MRSAHDRFNWQFYGSPERVLQYRVEALTLAMTDLGATHAHAKFISGGLPDLPFASNSFELALGSHLLFLYSEDLSLNFHVLAGRT
jgi:hypothetical protein